MDGDGAMDCSNDVWLWLYRIRRGGRVEVLEFSRQAAATS
jgi:hypothetical protein